ncbi:serine hydrolase domain-containing protein [Chitinophaga varians]|uniref:serine hydrolase domain-containing protein n=1 Tax=Chitinophaga varians TaxID=2202339 RepID=UPI001CB6CDB3|nr:serine hydrolase domain-containing protein [Chitinophaga varians]
MKDIKIYFSTMMPFKQCYPLLLLLLLTLCSPTRIISAQHLETRADSLISTLFKDPNGPGGVFMIARKGKPIYQKAWGKANLELDVPIKTDDVFQIGSMTKQFTAVAILLLEQQGKLSVKDPLSKYLPDYPSGDKITLHHLLTHTSGIQDFTRMKNLSTIGQKEMTPEMVIDFFKNEPVDSAPGEKYSYNNSGYFLLGYVIAKVSGVDYENFIQKNILDKVGMHNTYYATDRQIIKNRAYGYHKKDSVYVNKTRISYDIAYSAGALMSTVADLLKWQNALNQHLLLNNTAMQKAFTHYTLNNGEAHMYGYGWQFKDIKGAPARVHGGHIFGYKSMAVYIPGEDIYVVGLSNCDCNSPTKVTEDVAAIALEELK